MFTEHNTKGIIEFQLYFSITLMITIVNSQMQTLFKSIVKTVLDRVVN